MVNVTRAIWDLDRDDSFNYLTDRDGGIYTLQAEAASLRDRLRATKTVLELARARVLMDVQMAQTPEGKVRFTNIEAREAAVTIRLSKDDEAQTATNLINVLNNDLAFNAASLESQTRQRQDFLALMGYGAAWLNYNRAVL